MSDEVVRRAYELFEKRGRTHGSDWGDWFLAQSQVLKQVNFHVQAHAAEINISVEPRRVRICGRAETPDNHKAGEEIMYSLGHSLMLAEQIFHVTELPAEVDPLKAKVAFKDGKLEIVMRKAAPAKSARVQAKVA